MLLSKRELSRRPLGAALALMCCLILPLTAAHAQVCGDRVVTPPETCDDGNSRGGDGCSDTCQLDASIDFVNLIGGAYVRGSKLQSDSVPLKLVTIEEFGISRSEVTVYHYKQCVDQGGCATPATPFPQCNWGREGRETHPMNCVSWAEALDYADWLNSQDTRYTITLPSEAQWEYAAKSAGADQLNPWGDDEASCDYAIIREGRTFGCGLALSAPVCSRSQTAQIAPLAFPGGDSDQEVCDLIGNIAEWTLDYYEQNYQDAPVDGSPYVGFLGNRFRVVRGGSWTSVSTKANASYRAQANKRSVNVNYGIRLVSRLSCGDGVLDPYEECDDGNSLDDDGCDSFCLFECGNGALDGAEECDDGNRDPGDGCDETCTLEVCGNGALQEGEACDDGNLINGDGCDLNCNEEVCGNGVEQGHIGEDCDDGNTTNNDGCDANCFEEVCGNGEHQPHLGEDCDDGNAIDDDGCNNLCQIQICGDGVRQGAEACDDGANNSDVIAGACRTNCQLPGCGDGVADPGEACDDGVNNSDTLADACRTNCQTASCGDGVQDTPEACDDGANNSDTLVDACRTNCQVASCGDGVQDAGEACDDGANNSDVNPDACRTTCSLPTCGDAVVDAGDECDDGNLDHTDGCDETCKLEVCGNNIVQNYERRYLKISGGSTQSCGIMIDDRINCWGETLVGIESSKSVPSGEFVDLEIGSAHACALGTLGDVECWGADDSGQATPPADKMIDVSAGLMEQSCGVKTNGEIVCWGTMDYGFGIFPDPPIGNFEKVAIGGDFLSLHGCAITTAGEIECWGSNDQGQLDAPAGTFTDLSAGSNFTCALSTAGEVKCWGNNFDGQTDAPAGTFVEVSSHFSHSCARNDQDEIVCWGGFNVSGELDADNTQAPYISVDVGFSHSCAVTLGGSVVCWGDNGLDQSTPTPGPYETCDDGNTVDGDGCDATCTPEICGNGVQQGAEECDDNNTVDGDGCDAQCQLEFCGNGLLQAGEDCDDGGVDTALCNADCTLAACGDGVHNPAANEACDDAGESDTCNADCTLSACGDGIVNASAGEECDDAGESATCNADCTLSACGDGVLNVSAGEACDDAFNNDDFLPNRCRTDCQPARCGDTVIDAGETCDDGNLIDTDDCLNSCQVATCGDGVQRTDIPFGAPGHEECDDGNAIEKDACKAGCVAATCGDGIIRVDLVVGDVGFESCDDLNNDNGDGCSALCVVEPGSVCVGEPSVCVADADLDGVTDALDSCPNGETGWVSNAVSDYDSDGCRDDHAEDDDDDNDGVADGVDLCPLGNLGWGPSAPANDNDGDGCEDDSDEDLDDDNDTISDLDEDTNGNGAVDAGETDPKSDDTDADGHLDAADNCPTDPNPGNADHNGDGEGDACEFDAPVTAPDAYVIDEDTILNEDVVANDSDPDGDTLTASVIADVDPLEGTLVLNPAGTFTFTPAQHFFGVVTFTYSVSDGLADSAPVTVTITINSINDAPIAAPDSFNLDEDTVFSSTAAGLNITNNDSDVEGDPLTVVVVDPTANGALSFTGNDFTYTPNPNYEGADAFTYFVTDGADASNTVTVSITVNPINDAPVATFTTDQELDEGGALFNGQATFDDPDVGDTITFSEANPAIPGFNFNIADGSFVLNPAHPAYDDLGQGASVTHAITYTVTDSAGESDTATFNITVNGVNDAPVATFNVPQNVVENDPVASGTLTGTDVDVGDVLTYSLEAPIPAGVNLVGDLWSFDPDHPDYEHLAVGDSEVLTVTYTVSDQHGASDTGTFTITVAGANDAPDTSATADQSVTEGGAVLTGNLDVTDVDDGDTVTYADTTGGVAGFTLDVNTGDYTFDPTDAAYDALNEGQVSTITITYDATDSNAAVSNGSFDITITGTNDVPVATFSNAESVTEDAAPITGALTATDVDSADVLTFTLDAPTSGLTLLDADWTFDPTHADYQSLALGETLTLTINYTVTDLSNATDNGSFTITVTGVNDAPVATFNAQQDVNEGDAVHTGTLTATDVDNGDTLTFSDTTGGTAGFTLVDASTGDFSFDPSDAAYEDLAVGATRTVTITYDVTDNNAASSSDSFDIVVTGTNDAPIATFNAAQAVNEDAAPITDTLTATDADAGDVLTFTLDAPIAGLSLAGADWTFDATHADYQSLALGETATLTINYTVTDLEGASDGESFTITVTGVNDAPVATFDAQQDVNEGDAVHTGTLTATDVDNGDTLTFSDTTAPPVAGFTLVNPSTGDFSFDPSDVAYEDLAVGATRTVTITYDVTDDNAASSSNAFDIVVTGTNDAPIATFNAAQAVNEDAAPITDTLTATDADAGDVLTFTLDAPISGLTLLGADWTFDPTHADYQALALNEPLVLTVNYTVTDLEGATGAGSFDITVTGVNDAPIANFNTQQDVTEGDAVHAGTLTAVEVDNGDSVVFADTTGGVDGFTLVDANTGDFTFDPSHATYDSLAEGETTTLAISYSATDTNGAVSNGSFDIVVTGTNDAPLATFADAQSVNEGEAAITGNLTGSDVDAGDALTFSVDGVAPDGFSLVGDAWSFDPSHVTYDSLATGVDRVVTVNYIVTDSEGATANGSFEITVTGTNDAPVAAALSFSVDEDTPLTVDVASGVLSNDTDVDGDALTAELVDNVTNGALTLNPNGSFDYTPAADYHGPDSFTYQANDGQDLSAVITINITVNSVNDAPVAVADSSALDEDTTLNIAAPGLLANDTDTEGDALTAILVDDVTNGALTLNADGSLSYTPTANYHGVDSFTYKANDGDDSNVVTFDLTINPVNDAPVGQDDAYDVDEDGVLTRDGTVGLEGVLFNDSDVENDNLSVAVVTDVTNGVLVLDPTGTFTYTPNGDYQGPDSFTYQITDDGAPAETSAIVNVIITVNSVNDAPVAVDDPAYITDEDTQLTVDTLNGVLNNDVDVDHAVPADHTVTLVDATNAPGALALAADGSFVYTPDANFHGVASFTYTVSDNGAPVGTSNIATATITVNPVNDAPVGDDDAFNVTEDNTLTIAAPGVLGNDTDVEGDGLTVGLDTDVSDGALTLNNDGSFEYIPNPDFNGVDTFTYTITDDGAPAQTSAVVTVTITVDADNDVPVANDDPLYITTEDTTLNAGFAGVIDNDTDIDGDALTASLVDDVTDGTLTLNADGTFTYEPDANFNGFDGFTYLINDGTADSAVATVTIEVISVNDAPVAVDDVASVDEDQTLTVPAPGVLTNDSDVEGDLFLPTVIDDVTDGALTLNPDGSFEYVPNADFDGVDTFTYQLDDGDLSNIATVTITMNPVNDAPIAVTDNFNTLENQQLVLDAASGVLANDIDIDNPINELIAQVTVPPLDGALVVAGDGSLTYTPDPGFAGVVTFEYEVSDGFDTSSVVSTIDVGNVNDAPTFVAPTPAEGDELAAPEGVLLTFTATGDDIDAADVLSYSMTTDLPAAATLDAVTGVFEWTPGYEDAGTYNVELTVTDLAGASATVTFTVVSTFTDADNDTLPDTWETGAGLDPTTADSDNDNISDRFEVGDDIDNPIDTDGLAPIDALDNDSDEDGVPDAAEAGDADLSTDPVDTDGDGAPDFRDTDSDDDTLLDGAEDVNQDGVVDLGETSRVLADTDGDTVRDDIDNCPVDANTDQANFNGDADGDVCGDADGDGVVDAIDLCPVDADPLQENSDADPTDGGDACDDDDDNDGVLDGDDSASTNPTQCSDLDNDNCDDCSSGTFALDDDGADFDGDGACDLGDDDDDNDGSLDVDDDDDFDPNVCSDTDNDSCDDCVNGSFDVANDGADTDGDGICDAGDLCVDVADPAQVDTDGNGIGDECDCGDGVVAGDEDCDSGGVDAAGCDFDCTAVECGDGHTNAAAGETCDDGNVDNTDACVALGGVCTVASCGDGFVQEGVEGCDDGNDDNTDDCPDGVGGTCEPSFCGDGFVHAFDEACDDANLIEDDGCTNICETPACGDGILQGAEACDDGNLVNGDGCNDTCAESDDVLWIDIAGGAYLRGESTDTGARPVREVLIGDLRVMRTEVTVKQYQECVDAGACSIPEPNRYCNYGVAGREWHPINCVTQAQAIAYAAFRDSLDPDFHIRLPSEAEWEYIARSQGTANRYPWGFDDPTCDYAQIRSDGYGCGLNQTAPVCSTSTTFTPRQIAVPNGDTTQAVCDMSGNVAEWTLDVYAQSYEISFKDARPFQGGLTKEDILNQRLTDLRVTRGGAWAQRAQYLPTSSRGWLNRFTSSVNLGIRLVASLCGNGQLDGAEACDDGNHDIFDECNFLCEESAF